MASVFNHVLNRFNAELTTYPHISTHFTLKQTLALIIHKLVPCHAYTSKTKLTFAVDQVKWEEALPG